MKYEDDKYQNIYGITRFVGQRASGSRSSVCWWKHESSELATKSDLAILRKDIDLVRKYLDSTKIELKKDIDLLRLEFKKDIEMGFKDQLKWLIILMFGFSSLILAVIKLL